ncbi:uncharacterized protein F5147DRAFT_714436, partial [Suillus discolor]
MVTYACFSGRCRSCERLTGMNILAAYFLLSIGTVVYVVFGGLRATFMYTYHHSICHHLHLQSFIFHTYGTSPEIASLARMCAHTS